MNKFETMKQEKDGLDVVQDIPRFAQEGFESIPECRPPRRPPWWRQRQLLPNGS